MPPRAPVTPLKVTPEGNSPNSPNVGVGKPVPVTVNEPAEPNINVVLFPLEIAGGWSTITVKLCVAFDPTPLLAVNVIEYAPAVPAAGVPVRIPVVALNVTPEGREPDSVVVGAGDPVVVTLKSPEELTTNVALLALRMDGAAEARISVSFVT